MYLSKVTKYLYFVTFHHWHSPCQVANYTHPQNTFCQHHFSVSGYRFEWSSEKMSVVI